MMTAFARPSRLAMVAALPVLLAAEPLSVPLIGGTTYEFIVRAETGGKESVMMRGRGAIAGNESRLEILDGTSTQGDVFGGKGSYFLVKEGGKRMLLVDPTNKQYMEWNMASALAGLAKVMNAVGGFVKLELSDIKIDAQDLGAGETIQGYPTRHFRLIENYTTTAKIFGRSSKSRSETTTDFYFAPALKELTNPFVQSGREMAQSFDMFNNPDYKSQMTAAYSKIQHGVPLRSVVKSVATDEKGKQQVSVVTSEMVNFKQGDIPRSTFAIPDGYAQVEMPSLNASLAGGASAGGTGSGKTAPDLNADSITAAAKQAAGEGVKEAVKEEVKAEAKNAAAKKLKGIFKR